MCRGSHFESPFTILSKSFCEFVWASLYLFCIISCSYYKSEEKAKKINYNGYQHLFIHRKTNPSKLVSIFLYFVRIKENERH